MATDRTAGDKGDIVALADLLAKVPLPITEPGDGCPDRLAATLREKANQIAGDRADLIRRAAFLAAVYTVAAGRESAFGVPMVAEIYETYLLGPEPAEVPAPAAGEQGGAKRFDSRRMGLDT